jgi:hypothetical protein
MMSGSHMSLSTNLDLGVFILGGVLEWMQKF